MNMLNLSTHEILHVILSVSLLFALGAAIGIFYGYRKLSVRLSNTDALIDQLKHDLAGLCSAAVNMDNRLSDFEFRCAGLKNRVDSVELRENQPHSYQMAISKVRRGENVQSLVEGCGFSRGEAELLVRLYRDPDKEEGSKLRD